MNHGIERLMGKTIVDINKLFDDEIFFTCSDGSRYRMYHSQNCCEQVYIEDIAGELSDLIDLF
jgi:hypothetical protein